MLLQKYLPLYTPLRWFCSLGVAYMGARHPPPRSSDNNSESLHGHPRDWVVDPVLPEGWCYRPRGSFLLITVCNVALLTIASLNHWLTNPLECVR